MENAYDNPTMADNTLSPTLSSISVESGNSNSDISWSDVPATRGSEMSDTQLGVADNSPQSTNTTMRGPKPHDFYYMECGMIKIQVDDTLFRVPRFGLSGNSEYFESLFREHDKVVPEAHACDGSILHIRDGDVSATDFARLLGVIYPLVYSQIVLASLDEWTSVLHLASKWTFRTLRAQAIERLSTLGTPVDKVILGRKYKVDGWLAEAYAALCERSESLTLDEGVRMTMEDVIKISEARQAIRSGVVTAPAGKIHLIVERLLDIPQPAEGRAEGVALPSPSLVIDEPAEPADVVTVTEEEGNSHDGPPEEPADMGRISRLITSLAVKESHITKAALLSLISPYHEQPATMDSVVEVIAKAAAKYSAIPLVKLCSSLSEMVTPRTADAHRNVTAHDEIMDTKWLSDRLMHHSSLLVDHWANIGTQLQDLNTITHIILFLSGLIAVNIIPDDSFTTCWERIISVSQQSANEWGASLFDLFSRNYVSCAIQTPAYSLLVDEFFHRVEICSVEFQQWSGQWWPGKGDNFGRPFTPDPKVAASYYLRKIIEARL